MKRVLALLLACPLMGFAQNESLNFNDRQDFEDAERGFICTWDQPVIANKDGSTSYTLEGWDFLKKDCPETAHPSLWRQSQLNRIHGLFEVLPGKIYQVRGFDIANMTFIRSNTGWIVIDVQSTAATSAAGYALVKKQLGDLPIRAILITHPHADHFAGIAGIVDNAPNKDFDIIAPKGFYKHAQEENIIAGVAMGRRASYMYGLLLPQNEKGNIGTGLGQTNSKGVSGMPKPTREISCTGEKLRIDGIDLEFVYAPDAEAPVEFMVYLPQMKAFCTAEEITHNMHNLLTLRGAIVRNGLLWSKHIDKVIDLYGKDVEISFSSHHWPTWGNDRIVKMWTAQRDLYRYLHDQTLHMANRGMTPNEIAEEMKLPTSLDTLFHCRGYYGTLSHNVKSQYQMYFGWFDGNPAHLNPLPPVEEGKRYVEAMGGATNVMKLAQKAFDEKDYRWCATLLNHLVFADPEHRGARELLAENYRIMGYQSECGPWRNFYLTGAQELLKGRPTFAPKMINPKTIAGLENDVLFDFFAIQISGQKAAGKEASVGVHFSDLNEDVLVHLSNGALSHRVGSDIKGADLRLNLAKTDFVQLMLGMKSLKDMQQAGLVKVEGDVQALGQILSSMEPADRTFDIIEP